MTKLHIPRRRFLQGAAAAGAAFKFGTGVAPARAQTRAINMVGWNNPGLRDIFATAEKEVGVKINYDVLPAKWDDVMAKITLWGQTGYNGLDILFADDLIGGLWGMNGWADDLSGIDAFSKHSDDIVDNITALNKAVGGAYRIFFTLSYEPFMYNKDLVAKAPATWDELVSSAKATTKNGVWGWRPLGGEGHSFNTVLLMMNAAGANLDTLDDAATLTALQFMYDWVQTYKITPPSTTSEDNAAVEALAAAGKAAMWWTYDGGTSNILGVDKSVITKANLGIARWPMGPKSDIGLVHGWGYLLSKHSQQKDAAKDVLNWLAQTSTMKQVGLTTSSAPPYKSLFADADYLAKLPQMSAGPGWAELIRGAKFREPVVNHRQVTQLWNMFEKLGGYILSGQKNPKESQAWAIGQYKTIDN